MGAQSQGNKTSNISSQQRQDPITQHNAAPLPLQHLSACAAKVRLQRNNNQNGFSFPPEERVPFSQPRKDDGVRVVTARAPSQHLSACAMGQKKRSNRFQGKTTNKQQSKWLFFSS